MPKPATAVPKTLSLRAVKSQAAAQCPGDEPARRRPIDLQEVGNLAAVTLGRLALKTWNRIRALVYLELVQDAPYMPHRGNLIHEPVDLAREYRTAQVNFSAFDVYFD